MSAAAAWAAVRSEVGIPTKRNPCRCRWARRLDCEGRRRAGAEPDDHAILNKFNRLLRSYALEGIPPVAGLGSGRGHDCAAAALALARMAAIAAA